MTTCKQAAFDAAMNARYMRANGASWVAILSYAWSAWRRWSNE